MTPTSTMLYHHSFCTNSQPHHHKQMQVKGSNNDKHCLRPKSKFPTIIFYVLLTVLHRFATINIAHPCSVPMLSVASCCLSPHCLSPHCPHKPLLAGGQWVWLLCGNSYPQLPHHIAPPTHLQATARRGNLEVLMVRWLQMGNEQPRC